MSTVQQDRQFAYSGFKIQDRFQPKNNTINDRMCGVQKPYMPYRAAGDQGFGTRNAIYPPNPRSNDPPANYARPAFQHPTANSPKNHKKRDRRPRFPKSPSSGERSQGAMNSKAPQFVQGGRSQPAAAGQVGPDGEIKKKKQRRGTRGNKILRAEKRKVKMALKLQAKLTGSVTTVSEATQTH